jgi:hypothetical protein
MTRRGLVKAAAVGTAGIVGAMLMESEAAASTTNQAPASFTSTSSTPAVTATNTGSGFAVKATGQSSTVIQGLQNGVGAPAVAVRGKIGSPNGKGTGVVGEATKGTGVSGSSASGTGVSGSSATGTGVAGSTSEGYGVYGQTSGGYGVFGESSTDVGVYGYVSSGGTGVIGETGDGNGDGVYGGTSAGNGVEGAADSGTGVKGSSNSGYGMYGASSTNYGVVGTTTSGNGVYGQVSDAPQAGVLGRQLDASGNWAVYGFGNIGATGTKSAVVPAADGGEHLTLYCMESPECWFEDFGSARLSGGSAAIAIDPEFAQTVHTGQYHVFVQAEGECRGLSVQDKTAAGFVVRELGGGRSNVPFAYRIVALRKDVSAPRLKRTTLPAAPAS